MPAEVRFVKINDDCYRPASPYDRNALRHVLRGDQVDVAVSAKKKSHRLRLYFSVCQLLAEASDLGDKDSVSDHLLRATKRVREVHYRDGAAQFVPLSVAEMDDLKFAAFFEDAERYIFAELFQGLKTADFRMEVARRLGVTWKESRQSDEAGDMPR